MSCLYKINYEERAVCLHSAVSYRPTDLVLVAAAAAAAIDVAMTTAERRPSRHAVCASNHGHSYFHERSLLRFSSGLF